jgi:hypothetical protein
VLVACVIVGRLPLPVLFLSVGDIYLYQHVLGGLIQIPEFLGTLLYYKDISIKSMPENKCICGDHHPAHLFGRLKVEKRSPKKPHFWDLPDVVNFQPARGF